MASSKPALMPLLLCPDGLLSYTAPVGQTMNLMNLAEAVHLNDSTYDGHTTHTVGG